ncbi:hypothetical protein [Bacillus mesophilum]|uniref:Metallo-beta-lactamase domain-containing protein n=1 Tax=Bacillus mesophilum TaxID=1071718 RepID=A0A7V7RLL5_9BACI|nr:hypothetical protein [Bacillus mesophilum]KAB2332719.1 hypothetical protein F7732_11575 [Bacillus mesophilum]
MLNEGDEIETGNRMLTIYHTPEHISILENSNDYLFTGDLLYEEIQCIANVPNVTKVYGGHNTIGFDANLLQEVGNAVKVLKEKDQVM